MRGKTHEKGHAAHMHHRKKGGRIEVEGMKAGEGGGDPFVEDEAEEKKKGGRAKKHHRKHGGHVDGHKGHHRMDRKRGGRAHHEVHGHHAEGRKRGGRVGADTSPLTTAHNTTSDHKAPKEQEGGLSK